MGTSNWIEDMIDWARGLLEPLALYAPFVVLALLVTAIGWVVARLMRALARVLIRRFERLLLHKTGVEETRERRVASQLVSDITFWAVFLLFVAFGVSLIGLPVLNEALAKAMSLLPAFLGAALVLIAAFFLADIVKRGVSSAAASSGLAYADLLGQIAKTLVLVVAVVLALELLHVDSTILVTLLAIALGAFLFGAAFAFGLGARATVANILAAHYLTRNYRVGQTIRVQEITGRIVEIKPGGVILDAPEGRVVLPAATVHESITVLVEENR